MSPPHKGIKFKDLSSVNLCSRLLGITAVLNAVKMNSFGFFFLVCQKRCTQENSS
jgi:hypothetical protein